MVNATPLIGVDITALATHPEISEKTAEFGVTGSEE